MAVDTKTTSNRDAEFCGRVPLHQTNLIQPHGVLLVLDKTSGGVLQASENAAEVFGLPARELVAKSITELLGDDGNERWQKAVAAAAGERQSLCLQLPAGRFNSTLQQGEFLILEIESQNAEARPLSFSSVFEDVKGLAAAVQAAQTTDEACRAAVDGLKAFSGFDKVMIYRFDENWNGDVIAEAREEEMDSYLGLKFPASDIPKQARDLYKKMPFRLIPNVDYEPVKLYPVLNPQTAAFTNLSDSNLRSVAGVHLEYLRNMQVAASMSTRILKDGELWGLIACHHRTPAYLSLDQCLVFEWLSLTIAAKITAVQTQDKLALRVKQQQQLAALFRQVYEKKEIRHSLLSLLQADGLALVSAGRLDTVGLVPASAEIADLAEWLRLHNGHYPLHQPSLAAVYEPAEGYAEKASGLLALTVGGRDENFILAFRQEAVQKIAWGGNPNEAVRFESDGKKYHPRSSFRQWQQTVRFSAIPWPGDVLEIADTLCRFLPAHQNQL